MKKRIAIELNLISQFFPEANTIPFLPRKKKKKLKKKIVKDLLEMAEEHSNNLIKNGETL
jgi:hypothetical protein